MMKFLPGWVVVAFSAMSVGCASAPPTVEHVASVDLPRFMGDWYVIANIPSRREKDAYNSVESYTLGKDGKILTTFNYRDGGFDGPAKTMHPTGTVRPGYDNAVWGMQFIWPIKAEYVIAYVNADYSQTIVARSARDYAWVMARTPQISEADYDALIGRLKSLGYSLEALRKVPQRWP